MLHMIQQVAQEYIDQGYQPIPLSKKGDGKVPGHTRNLKPGLNGWETTKFKASQFFDDDNIGFNGTLSEAFDNEVDNDSKNAIYFAPKFFQPTKTLGTQSPTGSYVANSHYFFAGKPLEYIGRSYPDGTTIAELRPNGNTVVAPSIAESKLFKKLKCKRVWVDNRKPVENNDLEKQFGKVCVASVLKKHIKSFNMPIVKLTACLKRYCQDWSEDEIRDFILIVSDSIPIEENTNLNEAERKKIPSKIKTVLKNWEKESTKQSGYDSFATHVGLEPEYARDMFTWIGEVPKQGTDKDRKTIIDFVAMGMKEEAFQKKVERRHLVSPIICEIGLYVFAGRPKGGKSKAMRHLAYTVQNPSLGKWMGHEVMNGDVLGLFLEDNEDSMNLEIKEMGFQHKKKPTTFVEQCPTLERGFMESVRLWHKQMSNPKLVIIDTFQKIKPMGQQKTANANAYEIDYYYLSQLHALAKELHICIIYVHHLSQADKGHKWDKIMGSTGHQGVTDAMYMLSRDEEGYKGTLEGIGRNIAGFKFDIEWNTNSKEPFTFQYAGDTYQKQTQQHKRNIFMAMRQLAKDGEVEVKPAQVYTVLNLVSNKEKGACQKNMLRMKERAELRQGDVFGTYKLALPVEHYDEQGNIKSFDEPWGKKPATSSKDSPSKILPSVDTIDEKQVATKKAALVAAGYNPKTDKFDL